MESMAGVKKSGGKSMAGMEKSKSVVIERGVQSQFISRFGVDPVLNEEKGIPFCSHGPTLRFRRYYSDKDPREFYACAVHRDRKGCSFFCWADETISQEKLDRWKIIFEESERLLNSNLPIDTVESIKTLPSTERQYCNDCSGFLSSDDISSSHSQHSVTNCITDTQLCRPTSFLHPVDNRKSHAQFHFSDSSLELLHAELKRLDLSRVLCVGTPRLHEVLLDDDSMDSLLLDIDHRYAVFFVSSQYQRYNMFNHFFHAPGGQQVCKEFLELSPATTAIVMDPPFGGLAEILAQSLRKLWYLAGVELTTFLVFPYYLESHVTSALPSLWMMDYQVVYRNHSHFGVTGKKGRPSPVRIFSNLPRPGLKLRAAEGYWYCTDCNKFSAQLNAHCVKCGSCTSKDGRPYVHCELCKKCTKKGYSHCGTCNKCESAQHVCGVRSTIGCHICGSEDHKRKDCPKLKDVLPSKKKRRSSVLSSRSKPKRKKCKQT